MADRDPVVPRQDRSRLSLNTIGNPPQGNTEDTEYGGSEFEFSAIIPRDSQVGPKDPSAKQAISDLHEYLRYTGLENAFDKMCRKLFAFKELPYNPYMGMSRKMRDRAERFHMTEKSDDDIQKMLDCELQKSNINYLYHPLNERNFWGLENVLKVVKPGSLYQYEWLVEDLTPRKRNFDISHGYSNQVNAALVGPSVFHGTFYNQPPTFDVRLEFLITGPSLNKAVTMFVNTVIRDIRSIEDSGVHTLLGVHVKVSEDAEFWDRQFWDQNQMEDSQDEFWQILSDMVPGNHPIIAECVFKVDKMVDVYRKGQKEYYLTFVKTTAAITEEEQRTSFTDFSLKTLHEGIFLKQSHAEAYLRTYVPNLEIVNKDSVAPSYGSKGYETAVADDQESEYEEKASYHKVRTDGFTLGKEQSYGPDAWQITAPIKSHLQRKVARQHPMARLFDIAYDLILLATMDRASCEITLFVELYKLLNGTGSRLYALMQQNSIMQRLIQRLKGRDSSNLVNLIFAQYKQGMAELLDSRLHERSSDHVTASHMICQTIEEMLSEGDHGVRLNDETQKRLAELNSYCQTILLQLAEDSMLSVPAIENIINQYKQHFPDEIPRPQTRSRDPNKKGTGAGYESHSHGKEIEEIQLHDRQVISVIKCVEKETAPEVIKNESVLIKYMIDTHMDEVWSNFLLDLLEGAHLPPNPYPKLVSIFRENAMRMDLCYEPSEVRMKKILHGSARVEDQNNYIYTIPGCDVHGHQTALAVIDAATFFRLVPYVQQFIQRGFIKRKGAYRIAICCAVTGHTPLYGSMEPYLHRVELEEHCYIKGPSGCWGEAMEIYSKIVFEHVLDLQKKDVFPICAIHMGRDGVRLTVDEFLVHKKAFAAEFERYCHKKEMIYVKFYFVVEWRYIEVRKNFFLHYMNDDETQKDVFFPPNPAGLYQNVFLDAEKAAFHFQNGGPSNHSNPDAITNVKMAANYIDEKILSAKKAQDWLEVYRWLVTRNIMYQGTYVLPDSWRMLNSAAGQADYVITLGNSLADLVQYGLDIQKYQSTDTLTGFGYKLHKDKYRFEMDSDEEEEEELQGQRTGISKEEKKANRIGNLNITTLSRMAIAYRQKAVQVCLLKTAMAPRCLAEIVNTKLQGITEKNEATKQIYIIISKETIKILHEVSSIFKCLRDAIAFDVHCTCTQAQMVLRSIEADKEYRPRSVESVDLMDPLQYTSRPKANIIHHVDDWPKHMDFP